MSGPYEKKLWMNVLLSSVTLLGNNIVLGWRGSVGIGLLLTVASLALSVVLLGHSVGIIPDVWVGRLATSPRERIAVFVPLTGVVVGIAGPAVFALILWRLVSVCAALPW